MRWTRLGSDAGYTVLLKLLNESRGQQDVRQLSCLSKLAIFFLLPTGKASYSTAGFKWNPAEKTEDRNLGLLSINLYIHQCTFCYLLLLPHWNHGGPVPEVTWGVGKRPDQVTSHFAPTPQGNLCLQSVKADLAPAPEEERRTVRQAWGEHAKNTLKGLLLHHKAPSLLLNECFDAVPAWHQSHEEFTEMLSMTNKCGDDDRHLRCTIITKPQFL